MSPPREEPESDVRIEPWDEHNQRLVANVHPADWSNPAPKERYHLVVIGAGTAGLVTAIVAANLGADVALIERHLMGGDCLNVGCVPSKGIISAARAWDHRRREPFGAAPPAGDGDFAAAMERMRQLRAGISHVDSARRFSDAGVDVFLGAGRFVSDREVEVDGARLRFRRAVIATGARAAAPPIPGLDRVEHLTNETVFSLTERPRHLIVIGAGPIGCEMAQAFAQLGARVSLIDQADQVLVREDRGAAEVVQAAMQHDGVELFLGAEIGEIAQSADGAGGDAAKIVRLTDRDGAEHELRGDRLLVAVGRAPNVEGLGLEEVGVEYDRSGVKVDDKLRTTNRRIYAAGDVTPHLKFTHLADAHAGIVIQNALFLPTAKTAKLTVPWVTYTSPEIGHVGLYEHQAKEQGVAIDVIEVPLDDVDRAILDGEQEGFLKLVLKKGSDRILGATLVASHAGDMMPPLALAVTHGLGLKTFAGTIFPYPTQGEVLKKAANLWRKQRLSPRVAKVLRLWFRAI
ncbi:MAG: mercuric reductase [Acidobacteria bacterium]|nr:MAG: mercuric reductase [Acidobacteriota bacterium]REK11005.1 MAG: mercuric reductase [Acidobacteriota bacterium]